MKEQREKVQSKSRGRHTKMSIKKHPKQESVLKRAEAETLSTIMMRSFPNKILMLLFFISLAITSYSISSLSRLPQGQIDQKQLS